MNPAILSLEGLPPRERRIFSILGAKIDNVYDLFDMLKREGSFWNNANERYLI